ncbi:MAG: outer membrane beta-barrel protein [Pseudomonadota bacterium]
MLKYIIKFCCFLFLPFISFAVEKASEIPIFKPYNFVKLEAGSAIPTPLGNNTGLSAGKTTYTFGIAGGRKLDEFISLNLEYMFRGNSTAEYYVPGQTNDNNTSWTTKSHTFMMNLSLDLMPSSRVTPYIIAGGGISINKPSTYNQFDDKSSKFAYSPGKTTKNFAWQLGLGINFNASETFSTEIEYRFIDKGTVETQPYQTISGKKPTAISPIKGNFRDNVIMIGLKIKF